MIYAKIKGKVVNKVPKININLHMDTSTFVYLSNPVHTPPNTEFL